MNKLFIFLMLIVLIGCKKEVDQTGTPQNIDQEINTPPKVFAGNNITVTLPEDSVKLEANVVDAENNIAGYIWKKISGPLSYRLLNGNSVHAKVFDLTEGIYEFELTVTDKGALTGRDTVSVIVEPPINTAPKVSAGADLIISLPIDHVTLTGSATDAQNNIQSFLWRKITGPGSNQFENANSVTTKVSGLERGVYEFEFMVTDQGGLIGKDTVSVFVIDPAKAGTNEIIFSNLPCECPRGCYVYIVNFRSYIPIGISFKVYTKKQESSSWNEAAPVSQWTGEKFVYYVENNILFVYSEVEGNLNQLQVKLVF